MRHLLCFLLAACTPLEPETQMNKFAIAAASVAGLWTATGGTITPTGLYTADTVPGAYVVAYDSAGLHATARVTVCDVAGLEVTPDSAVMDVGDTVQVNAAYETHCLTADTSITVFWESRDEAVATVEATGTQRGRITAVAAGQTWVLGRDSLSTRFDSTYVCVRDYYSVDVDSATMALETSGTTTGDLVATVQNCGSDTTDAVTWVSRSTSVATVASTGDQTATVTAVALGTTWVVATKSPGGADSTFVTVSGPCTASATTIAVGDSIQAKVNAQPSGTGFTLCAGTFRLQSVTPKSGMTFTGAAGYPSPTVLSGARVLTAWTAQGTYWVHGGQTQQGSSTSADRCQSGHEACGLPEDLFIDNALQRRVTSLAQVSSGKWYFDYAADKVYIATNPSGKTIEISVIPHAFSGSANGVTLKRLTIEKYATPAQLGTVNRGGDNWTIDSVVVSKAHGTCIKMDNGWTVTRSRVHHCGQLGIAGGADGSLVDSLQADSNATVGFNVGFAGGASKFHGTTNLIVRYSRWFDNDGNGIWLDIDNIDYRVHHNEVFDNFGQGIFVEISYDGQVDSNTVTNNGHERGGSWLYGAGILIAHSPNVEVFGNTVSGNYNGIAGIQQNRGSGKFGTHLLSNLNVHDNVICMARGKSGVGDGTGSGAFSGARNNDFADNDYTVPNTTGQWWSWSGGGQTWTQWQAIPQDASGSRAAGSC